MYQNKSLSALRIIAAFGAMIANIALAPNTPAKSRVELPAGSRDGLAAAVARAGRDGIVIVKTGTHSESGTVVVTFPVRIVGESGAVIKCGNSFVPGNPIPVVPTIHILGTERVVIEGLQFRAAGPLANTAVLIEKSSHVRMLQNDLAAFEMGIVLQFANHVVIRGNTLANNPAYGILVVNGASATIEENVVSGSGFGIFASDRDGLAEKNQLSSCFVGIILCHLPPGAVNISGDISGAQTRCSRWLAEGNIATGNTWGYQVIDGSHECVLVNNAASGNSQYDIELVGQTSRYGFSSPPCFDNVVIAGQQKELVVKDCGDNDIIIGDVDLVDHNLDPCD